MSNTLRNATFAICTGLAAAIYSAAHCATVYDDDGERLTARLSYRATDLYTPDGARRLAWRVQAAASEVCGADNPVTRHSEAYVRCRENAIAHAIAGMNAPMLADALAPQPRVIRQASR
jgi:UrcA family protein